MKVFLSWSGDLSHKVATLLRDWLPSVIQSIEPYVSSEDVDKGARWSTDIAKELEASGYGIVCVTRDNLEAPWLNFEAGALSKSIDKGRVSPFLFSVKRSEIKTGPLLQFQSTIADKEDVSKLLHSMNAVTAQGALDESRLNSVFDVWWPQLEAKLHELEKSSTASAPVPSRSERDSHKADILEEVLELVRQQHRILNDPTALLPRGYIESVLSPSKSRTEWHPVFDDIEERWSDFWDQVRVFRETTPGLPEPMMRSIERLARPMEYFIENYSRSRVSTRTRRKLIEQNPSAG